MRDMSNHPLVRLERVRQQWGKVEPAPHETHHCEHQDGDADRFVFREECQLRSAEREIQLEIDQHELRDDQCNDRPVQSLRDCAPAGSSIADGHAIKLKRVNLARTIRFTGVVALAALLAGCAGRTREAETKIPTPERVASHQGRPFQLLPARSLLTILVYRGGSLARMGHNHVVASRDLEGTVYVTEDLTRASFEVRIPVAKLTVDDAELRAQAGPDFPPVPDSAKEGTRRNMLSESLLDAEHFPEILLNSQRVDVTTPKDVLTQVQVTVRDQNHTFTLPVHYELAADALSASGELPLKHSELGLTPFSAMMGAMQVQDEMKVRFKLYFAP